MQQLTLKKNKISAQSIYREIIEYVEYRFQAVRGRGWRLRELHKEALRRFLERILEEKVCKSIVQMPTGAGKSVLLTLLAVATAKLREHGELDQDRDVILVLAPLTRIKRQLYDRLTIGGGRPKMRMKSPSQPVFGVHSLESERSTTTVTEDLHYLLRNPRRRPLVLLMCPHVLSDSISTWPGTLDNIIGTLLYLARRGELVKKRREIREILKRRILALMVDEVHYLYSPRSKLGKVVSELARAAPVALGFTATPLRESFELILGKKTWEFKEALLLEGPIHSAELMENAKRRGGGNVEPILIPGLKVIFYKTIHKVPSRVRRWEREKEYWRRKCRSRVEKYAEILVEKFEEFFNVKLCKDVKAKILVLAPNTGEADIWSEVLKDKLKGMQIFIVHSKLPRAQEVIENFVKGDSGVLVAVDMVKLGFDDPNLDALVIARPMKSPVAYVQARGRVLRWPTRNDCLKLKKMAALILHLAADNVLENDELVARVERGEVEKSSSGIKELQGYGEGKDVLIAEVEVKLLKEISKNLEQKEHAREVIPLRLMLDATEWGKGILRIKLVKKYSFDEIIYLLISKGKIYICSTKNRSLVCDSIEQAIEELIKLIQDFLKDKGIPKNEHLQELNEILGRVRSFLSKALKSRVKQRMKPRRRTQLCANAREIPAVNKHEIKAFIYNQLRHGSSTLCPKGRLRRALRVLNNKKVQIVMEERGSKQYLTVWYKGRRVARVRVQSTSKTMTKLCNVLACSIK